MTILALSVGWQSLHAQVNLPPNGNNQRSVVKQYMGMAYVGFDYHSPDVHAPDGTDRRGHIWGELVPYGLNNLGFGPSQAAPWRAGANENTVFFTSHDIVIQGEKLPAGKYGFHIIVEETGDWTLIFNENTEAWGSFYYEPELDVLRVKATPEESHYHEYLTFGFTDRSLESCTAYLAWEDKMLPFTIEIPNVHKLYMAQLKEDLTGQKGFSWVNLTTAANYAVQNGQDLDQALAWAEAAVSQPFVGQANFATLSTKANVLRAMEKEEEADETMQAALELPGTSVFQIHQYGRQLIGMGKAEAAMEVFEYNAERFPDTWPINVGLARGYSAIGEYKKALKHAELALEKAPDDLNRNSLTNMIEMLKNKQDVN